MNKKILCVLPLSLLVVACGSQQGLVVTQACEKRTPKPVCTPNRDRNGTPFVNVTPHSDPSKWKVVPFNVCVKAQDKLVINILGPTRSPGTVVTYPKKSTDRWVYGDNSSDKEKIFITVPPKPDDRDHADYNIISVGDGCVDPRFTYE